jgi:hypothetical protein
MDILLSKFWRQPDITLSHIISMVNTIAMITG